MKKKQLFKPVSLKKRSDVTLGNRFMDKQSAYILGYYNAAKKLSEYAITQEYDSEKDSLIYPICFNYRHYIEIHLKSLIEQTEFLYEKMDTLGYLKNGNLDKKVTDTDILNNNHNIECLLVLLKERLYYVQIFDEEFPEEIAKYIKEMHDTDINGQKYRYYKNKSEKLHFPEEKTFDLKNMKEIMGKVNDTLWAIDGYLDSYIEMSNDILSEMSY